VVHGFSSSLFASTLSTAAFVLKATSMKSIGQPQQLPLTRNTLSDRRVGS
jgi:hypothetical protein